VKKILSIVFFAFSFLVLCRALLLSGYPDFAAHYYGLSSFLSGVNPYLVKGHMFTVNVYPPFESLFFSPFSLVSFLIAAKVWTVLSIIFLLFSVYLIFKINNKKINTSLGFLVLGLSCLYFPTRFTLGMGQINNLILFLVVLSVYLLSKNRSISSGVLLALSFTIKFFPVIFIPYLLIVKKHKILFYSLLFFSIFTIIGFILGPSLNFFYFEKIFPSLLTSWKGDYYNQAATGFLVREIPSVALRGILRSAFSLLIIIFSFIPILMFSNKTKERINLEFSILISASLIANNFSWQHHFVLLLFPLITALIYLIHKKLSLWYYLLLGLSYVLTGLNLASPAFFPVVLQSHVFYGALLLWGLNLKLLLSSSRERQH
jgi:hypothetical protein